LEIWPKAKMWKLKGNLINSSNVINFYIKNVFYMDNVPHVIGFGGESGSSLLRNI
jgi:hypothetical protein